MRKQIDRIDWQNLSDNAVLIILTLIALIAVGLSGLMNWLGFGWWDGFLQNFATEMIGGFVTFLLFEKIVAARQRRQDQSREDERRALEAQRTEQAFKDDLVRRAGSIANTFAMDAVAELRKRGLLGVEDGDDGLLAGADLNRANLEKAYLRYANLSAANLERANLRAANLERANLRDADLYGANLGAATLGEANLSGADLSEANLSAATLGGANLSDANLGGANLSDANLRAANLSDANLWDANLSDANLRAANLSAATLQWANLSAADLSEANLTGAEDIDTAKFDEKTLLPDAQLQRDESGKVIKDNDGTLLYGPASYWTPDTDMTRYTNTEHPNYWLPQWAAAGFEHYWAWIISDELRPWRDAGYRDDHMAWVRSCGDDWQPDWVAAGHETFWDWSIAGEPRPWHEAGYGDDHMAWLRAGKPERKPDDDGEA